MISQKARWAALAFLVLAGWIVFGWSRTLPSPARTGPSPALSPRDVVAAVVDALQHNDSPLPNSGISAAYRFASPANRRVTGPYGRFFRLVRTPPNPLLMKPAVVEYTPLRNDGNEATEDVTLRAANAAPVKFRFLVSRQQEGACSGCWMVDGVVPVP